MFWIRKATAAATGVLVLLAAGFAVGLSARHVPGAAGQEKDAVKQPDLPPGLRVQDGPYIVFTVRGLAPGNTRTGAPEPYTITLGSGQPAGARTKDVFETALKKKVCAGTMTLVEAQREIGVRWVHAYYAIP